ncbi:hypothetical protein HZS_7226 [Henneguya salminicola]|nr:hypothetical protein HZS_7226 [Henneguya salminicola]
MATGWKFLNAYLDDKVCKNLLKNTYTNPTYVQSKAILPLLNNKDVVAIATTGSGKTLAFVIPTILLIKQNVKKLKKHMTCALIISPTQELALQTHCVFKKMTAGSDLKPCLVIGGHKNKRHLDDYKEHGGHIMVSTPGVLESLLSNNSEGDSGMQDLLVSSFQYIEILILDEADKLLEMGFDRQISLITSYIPRQRRTGLYSATDSPDIQKLASFCLRNPVFFKCSDVAVCAKAPTQCLLPKNLKNYYMMVSFDNKFASLSKFIQDHKNSKIIAFFATTFMVDYFGVLLSRLCEGQRLFMLHGKLKKKRLEIYQSFLRSKKDFIACVIFRGVLLTSDLLSRGVDIPSVDWIIQFEVPRKSTTFLHRSGRTARLGHTGNCVTLLYSNEINFIHFIKLNQGITLKKLKVEEILPISEKIKKFAVNDRFL